MMTGLIQLALLALAAAVVVVAVVAALASEAGKRDTRQRLKSGLRDWIDKLEREEARHGNGR